MKVRDLREQYEAAKQVAAVDSRLLPDWSWWALMTRFNVPADLGEDFYFATETDDYPEIYYAKARKASSSRPRGLHQNGVAAHRQRLLGHPQPALPDLPRPSSSPAT